MIISWVICSGFEVDKPRVCQTEWSKSEISQKEKNKFHVLTRSRKWRRAKTNRILPRERTGHSKHPLPTKQDKTLHVDITRWSILKSDWLYSLQPKMETLYTVSKTKTGSWLWLWSWAPYCKLIKLKKVGKNTRTFRYDLNQIPYDYTVEGTNRFEGLDLIDKSAWRTMDGGSRHRTGGRDQDYPQEKEMQKGKMVVWGGLKMAEKRREAKGKEKRKDIRIWMQSSKK